VELELGYFEGLELELELEEDVTEKAGKSTKWKQ